MSLRTGWLNIFEGPWGCSHLCCSELAFQTLSFVVCFPLAHCPCPECGCLHLCKNPCWVLLPTRSYQHTHQVTPGFSLTWVSPGSQARRWGNIVIMKVFLSSLVSPRNILKISDSLEFRDFFLSLDLRDILSTLILWLSSQQLWGA